MLDKKLYWPKTMEEYRGKLKPRYFIPYKYLFTNKEGITAFNKVLQSDTYWVSSDSANCLKQNKAYLANLLKEYTIIELGGFDGSALNDIYSEGKKKQYKYLYINVDIGNNVKLLMEKNFKKINNVKYSVIKNNFDKIKFIKKIRTSSPKAILFLGNTFNNYYIKKGDMWLKELYSSMNNGDILILGLDKRVSAKEHLNCYSILESGQMTMLAARAFGLPIRKLRAHFVFDQNGIHGGVKIIEDFKFKNKLYKKGNFIEVFVSLKLSIKNMIKRTSCVGFKSIKVLKSSQKHIYHLILKKDSK